MDEIASTDGIPNGQTILNGTLTGDNFVAEKGKASVTIEMSPMEGEQKSSRSQQLFQAVSGKGNLELWEALKMEMADPKYPNEQKQLELMEVDKDKKTILHHAVLLKNRKLARRITREILEEVDKLWDPNLIDMQDADGNTALHLAVEAGREKVTRILLMRKPNLAIKNCSKVAERNKKRAETGLELIQNKMPELLRFQYDQGVCWVDEEQEQIQLNFNKITESHYNFDVEGADDLDKHKESNNFSGVLKGRSDHFDAILDHPLVQVFLSLKYNRAYPFIIISILFHIAWHVIYAYFIFKVYYTNCPWKPEKNAVLTNDSIKVDTTINCDRSRMDAMELVLGVVCWVLGLLFVGKEIFEIYTAPSKFRYFLELENLGQLFVCASVILTSWPVYEYLGGAMVVTIHPWQYKVSALTLFVVWTLVLGQICKIQELRIYIEIFLKVIKSFSMFICTFASLLLAFASSLCILMPEGKAFTSPWLAVPKVLVMMTGELNYDDVFYGDSGSGSSPDHYLTTQVLFSLFTILMSMVLLNMLIGLAVNDTQELRQQSHIAALYSMLQEIYLIECFAFRLHKELRCPWLLKRLSINQDTQAGLTDPLTRCIFKRKRRDEQETNSISGTRENLNILTKVDFGLFYRYNTTKRNEHYPFPEELMGKLTEIADGRNHEDENQMREAWIKFLSKGSCFDKHD